LILEQAGHVHESVEALEQMLTQRPDDPTLLNALGYTLADHTLELGHAEGLIRRALAVMPDNPQRSTPRLGAFPCRRRQRAPSALSSMPMPSATTPRICRSLGEALWVSGKRGEARRVWRRRWCARPIPARATLKGSCPMRSRVLLRVGAAAVLSG